jgi:hypothetical protein
VGAIIALVQIFFKVVFDPPRHIGLLALIMTMPAGLALVELGRHWILLRDRSRLTAVLVALVCILVPYGFFGGLRFYDASYFTVTASEWLQAHAPRNARILSNNHSILFYGGFRNYDSNFSMAVGRDRSIAGMRDWRNYDYVVLHLRQSRLFLADDLEKKLGRPPVKTFENSRGDKVVIFKLLP